MATLLAARWKKVQRLSLKAGAHKPDSTFCVMEAVAFVAGEKWSDTPECACPVISAFLRSWNDALPTDADRDRLLRPLIPKMVNTRHPEREERRAMLAADWLIRVHTPAWLRLAGLTAEADALADLPEITGMAQAPLIKGPLEAAQRNAASLAEKSLDAARGAAWDAARGAAWYAALAAARRAALAAARGAALDAARGAAWDAALDAAWDAALGAARATAALGAVRATAALDAALATAALGAVRATAALDAALEKLTPTMLELQQSAVLLVERMISLE
jgi:hypothetical protein